ncbi:hypothetical protein [Stakelama marina]|uniref:Spermidine synthase n=1 Tax=Stakelama marina TaxID=2826939 RepID=A0A8T4ID93_9SPHN|nr:hypothetical protein [Stakelama marina]MBR0551834.1 hypothetical protein [Stakelama marina]
MSETVSAGAGRFRRPAWLYVATILIGSFLLFLVQPMAARMALPRLGGAPAVWNSAMLVYQALLLAGYGYAHALGYLSPKRQAAVHLVVLALGALWLPIGLLSMELPAGAEPAIWVPWLFGASIGPLFFAVAAQAPLVQRWYAVASGGRDPYALYAASNLGSFAGLLAYPLLVEPELGLGGQSGVWTAGYILLFACVVVIALWIPRGAPPEARTDAGPPSSPAVVARWIMLAFVPSGLMLATTTFITVDIVAVPLLWVLPLGLYLLSFTVAFAQLRGPAEFIAHFAPLVLLVFGGVMMAGHEQFPFLNVVMALALLFAVAVALHSRMYTLRPNPERLTQFYLAMAVGGALGGVFAGLVAPVLFDWTYEYPLLVLAAGALAPQYFLVPQMAALWRGMRGRVFRYGVIALALVVAIIGAINPGNLLGEHHDSLAYLLLMPLGIMAIGRRGVFITVLAAALFVFGGYRALLLSADGARTRSYFGVYTVRQDGDVRWLSNGTTLHGMQLLGSPERERTPTSYYVAASGVGRAMRAVRALYGNQARVGVVGLGTGTLACYAQPGQRWRFFEIDPTDVRIARDSGEFSFLRRCRPHVPITIGDARLSLGAVKADSFDLLVLDAFSSDTVPIHLLTQQAFATYGRALAGDGLLMVHISNRYLDLEPVIAGAAESGGWATAALAYPGHADVEGDLPSIWVAMSRDADKLNALVARGGNWRALHVGAGAAHWTDDYAAVVPLLRALQPGEE